MYGGRLWPRSLFLQNLRQWRLAAYPRPLQRMSATNTIDLDQLGPLFDRLGLPPERYDPLLHQLAPLLVSESRRCFEQSRGPDGVSWRPLKRPRNRARDRRARAKAKGKGRSDKPLLDTGLLMASIYAQPTGPLQLTQGSRLEYAGYQNDGTRHIPARPFLGVSEDGLKQIEQATADFVVTELLKRSLIR